jgi:hypothetical protein
MFVATALHRSKIWIVAGQRKQGISVLDGNSSTPLVALRAANTDIFALV